MVMLAVPCRAAPRLRPQVGGTQRPADGRTQCNARRPRGPRRKRILALPGVPAHTHDHSQDVLVLVRARKQSPPERHAPLVWRTMHARLCVARLRGRRVPSRPVSGVHRDGECAVLLRKAKRGGGALLAAAVAPPRGACVALAERAACRSGRRSVVRRRVRQSTRVWAPHMCEAVPCRAVCAVCRAAGRSVPLRPPHPDDGVWRPRRGVACAGRRVCMELWRGVRRAICVWRAPLYRAVPRTHGHACVPVRPCACADVLLRPPSCQGPHVV